MKIPIPVFGIGLICLGLAVVAGGSVAGEWMLRRFSAFDLSMTPQVLPAYAAPGSSTNGWRTFRSSRTTARVPPEVSRRQSVSVEPDALVLTNSRQTLWISVTAPRRSSRMAEFWYASCLHSKRNPLLLMGKAAIVPPLGTRRPEFWQKKVGNWNGFFYGAPRRVVADLFDASGHVRVVVMSRDRDLAEFDWIYDFLASIRYRA
ncbi:MAG: hypothetical protein HY594_04345 [Candidatus Omnitrophica bacterium]|nr:hypothetical protein [Candidatus Omnitrophota bacterium]